MMQRIFLVRSLDANEAFDRNTILSAIRALPNVEHCMESSEDADWMLKCALMPDGERRVSVPIELRRDLKSISIGAFSEAGLAAAIQIQRNYGREVYAFAEESLPEVIELSTVSTPVEMATRLKIRD